MKELDQAKLRFKDRNNQLELSKKTGIPVGTISRILAHNGHQNGISLSAINLIKLTKESRDFTLIRAVTNLCGGKFKSNGKVNKISDIDEEWIEIRIDFNECDLKLLEFRREAKESTFNGLVEKLEDFIDRDTNVTVFLHNGNQMELFN